MIIHQDSSEIYFRIFKNINSDSSEDHSFVIPAGQDWAIESYGLSSALEAHIQLIWDIGSINEQVIDSTYGDVRVSRIEIHNRFFQLKGDGTKKLGLRLTVIGSILNTTNMLVGGYIRVQRRLST